MRRPRMVVIACRIPMPGRLTRSTSMGDGSLTGGARIRGQRWRTSLTCVTRRAKIVCTLGPATADPERIKGLVDAGMNVARLNFSHGDHSDHERMYRMVRDAADAADR